MVLEGFILLIRLVSAIVGLAADAVRLAIRLSELHRNAPERKKPGLRK